VSAPTQDRPSEQSEDQVAEPLLRDPPPPPGYVDPLDGSVALTDPDSTEESGTAPGEPGPAAPADAASG